MDGRTTEGKIGLTDGRTGRGQTVERIDGRTEGRTDGPSGRTDGSNPVNGRTDERG